MTKVAIDITPLRTGHAFRGIGAYTRNLLAALAKRSDIKLVDTSKNADIYHLPHFDLFFNTLNVPAEPTVVTVFDVIPLIYPKHYPPGIKGRIRFLKQKMELGKVAAVITISETSKKDIVRFLDIPPEKIYVTHLAPASVFKQMENGKWKMEITKRYQLPKRFVLYVGDVNYNKNILGLVKACKIAKIPLVIVGKQAAEENFDRSHPENKSMTRLMEKYGDDPAVLRLGFVPEEDLVALYNLATVYCQPSFYEGFGLPVLEAMACGLPVVATRTQALVEIAEGVALFVSPENPRDIADKIMQVVSGTKLRNDLIKSGLAYTRQFSWDKVADETIKVYQAVVG